MGTRKQYTKEFKSDAISLVFDQGHTTTEVSRSLEINAGAGRSPAVESADQTAVVGKSRLTINVAYQGYSTRHSKCDPSQR